MQTVSNSIWNLNLLLCVTLHRHAQNEHHPTWDYNEFSFLNQKFTNV